MIILRVWHVKEETHPPIGQRELGISALARLFFTEYDENEHGIDESRTTYPTLIQPNSTARHTAGAKTANRQCIL